MEKETVRIIMMKNGETVIDETNPQSVILSITQKESPEKIAQQMLIIGHPKDVFMANQKLSENVQRVVVKQIKQDLEEHPENSTAKSLLHLIGLLDVLSPNKESNEPDCENCPVKDECDEYVKPEKGKCA